MKTSIFDMNFVLPPLVVMTEVEKEMVSRTGVSDCFGCHTGQGGTCTCCLFGRTQ
jgi:hypothetical protein